MRCSTPAFCGAVMLSFAAAGETLELPTRIVITDEECAEINAAGTLHGRPVGVQTSDRGGVRDGILVFTGKKSDAINWFLSDCEGLEGIGGDRGYVPIRNVQYDMLTSALLRTGDIDIIRAVQGDLPLRSNPFADAAQTLGMTEAALVEHLVDLRRRGCLRRIAGILRHRDAGFAANGMAVWDVPQERIREVGEAMAGYTAISHCYERPRYDDWPYNVFTMVHAHSTEECDAFVAELAQAHDLPDHAVLYSSKEYKKVRARYFTPEVAEWERRFVWGPAAQTG